jgi:hypothetical protein
MRLAGRRGVIVAAAFLALAIQAGGAQAASCSPVRASGNPEILRLQRQIAANRAFQVKYNCAAGATFACREIAGRIAETSARLVRLSGGERQVCAKPVFAERPPARRMQTAAARDATGGYVLAAKIETRCVRLSDGYSFPTPNSGYSTAGDVDAIVAQCKFICDDPAMDVYKISGADRNTDEMISVTTGERYAQLPRAGAYRTASPLKTCDVNRFYKTVLAKTSAADTVASGAVDPKTAHSVEEAVMDVALLGDVGLRGTASFVPAPPRKIRIVGAAFLPEE